MNTDELIDVPIISLWQPWAQWLALGWKTIESRTHPRFASLEGKTIGIHAALMWDKEAIELASPYLTPAQIAQTEKFPRVGGSIICTATVSAHRVLLPSDAQRALIECTSIRRFGLIVSSVKPIEPIPAKGKQGIWYLKRTVTNR